VLRAVAYCAVCVGAPALAHAQALSDAMRPVAAEWIRVARIADARAPTQAQVDTLLAALRSPSAFVRAESARGIGRLERASLGLQLGSLLSQDPSPVVRAAAASAIAQSARDTSDASRHLYVLRFAFQAQPQDRAILAEHIGRTPHGVEFSAQIVNDLVPLLGGTLDEQVGALRGMVFVLRQQPSRRAAFDGNAISAVRRVAQVAQNSDARRTSLALSVLTSLAAADAPTLRAALADTALIVRRDALVAAGTAPDTAAARAALVQGLNDRAGLVRYEALRVFARRFGPAGGCDAARTAVRDTSTHVKLLAIDLLGGACRPAASAGQLDSIAGTLPAAEHGAWHAAAHALVSLARVDSARARARLQAFLFHPNFFARAYAARAAGVLGDEPSLRRAAADPHANVRTAAIPELSRIAGHRADSVYIAQLQRTDVELILAATAALEGSTDARALPALIASLERMSEPQLETSRDGRLALLERIGAMGRPTDTRLIAPFLRDIDPMVSDKVADIVARWNPGEARRSTALRARVFRSFPTFDELAALDQSHAVIELVDGGTIVIRLLPFDAPTNAERFARLAQRGYFDGLTLHRVVPNFVVQGGSPGANEYHGDGPFTRDEVGVPNWRGTVGLSTRGRDTGDAQFYFNQIDNIRLDYDYTIFGVVTRGMDVVDALQEGARIRTIRIVR
jgi:cyclophilin family peptidyl-prolyl cis-trans isomerase/HEAT repeat protein